MKKRSEQFMKLLRTLLQKHLQKLGVAGVEKEVLEKTVK